MINDHHHFFWLQLQGNDRVWFQIHAHFARSKKPTIATTIAFSLTKSAWNAGLTRVRGLISWKLVRLMLHTCTPSRFLFNHVMKFAGPCFQHQLSRPQLGLSVISRVISLSSCNALSWMSAGLVPLNDYTLLLSGDKSNRESRGKKRSQCRWDSSHLMHLHVFFSWTPASSEKTSVFVSHFCAGLGKNMCQLGFGWLLSWPGGIRALNEALFETMRFGSIWFTPDKTLGDLFEIGLITLKWSPPRTS